MKSKIEKILYFQRGEEIDRAKRFGAGKKIENGKNLFRRGANM